MSATRDMTISSEALIELMEAGNALAVRLDKAAEGPDVDAVHLRWAQALGRATREAQ